MRLMTALVFATASVVAVGCSSKSAVAHEGGLHVLSTEQAAVNIPTTNGRLAGKFLVVGGPYPGSPRLTDGTIVIHAKKRTGRVVQKIKTHHGHFSATVAPGTYVLVGFMGPGTDLGQGCSNNKAITMIADHTTRVTVQCDVP